MNSTLSEITNAVFMSLDKLFNNVVNHQNSFELPTNANLFHIGQRKVILSTVTSTSGAFTVFADVTCTIKTPYVCTHA